MLFPKPPKPFKKPESVSGNPQQILRRIVAPLLFASSLFFISPADSSANPTAHPLLQQFAPDKNDCSMSNFFSDVKQFFGIRYRFGGQTASGFDCSGFVRFMYDRVFSMKLPRSSREMAEIGVFFQTRGNRISHVGIFVGNDTFVHSSVSKGITEDKLQQNYYDKRYAGAVRVLDNIIPVQPETTANPDEQAS